MPNCTVICLPIFTKLSTRNSLQPIVFLRSNLAVDMRDLYTNFRPLEMRTYLLCYLFSISHNALGPTQLSFARLIKQYFYLVSLSFWFYFFQYFIFPPHFFFFFFFFFTIQTLSCIDTISLYSSKFIEQQKLHPNPRQISHFILTSSLQQQFQCTIFRCFSAVHKQTAHLRME